MKWANLKASLRLSAGAALYTALGRIRGATYIPHPRTMLFIEPVSFCNLRCAFCTYRLDLRPHTVMSFDAFSDYADQALAMGFHDLVLTPINGDVFMDKGFLDKLAYLEGHHRDHGIVIYTNLIAAPAAAIPGLLSLRRLKLFQISIYGHDLDAFRRITGRGEAQFLRLLANLAAIEAVVRGRPGTPSALTIGVRTACGYDPDDGEGELAAALRRLRRLGVPVAVHSTLDDWGGLIREADLGGLDMRLLRGRLLVKNGACLLPFFSVQILADGRVNACACRDIRSDLLIGDLRRQALAEILSDRNPAYTALIEAQLASRFPQSCRGCSFYRSIHDRRIAGTSPLGEISLDEFRHFLAGER